MDTSGIYIKMCDCAEVQEDWTPQYGDYVSTSQGIKILTTQKEINFGGMYKFLPRQDQIQEQLTDKFSTREMFPCLHVLIDFMKNKYGLYETDRFIFRCRSWEQLWLAFYMHEKHGKIWNGEEWEPAGKEE